MNEKELLENSEIASENTKEFALEEFKLNPLSSAEMIKEIPLIDENDLLSLHVAPPQLLVDAGLIEEKNIEVLKVEDPIFKELAAPKLPELAKENRARLQMQSPNKIQFYWSIKHNPFQTLTRAFGGNTGNYRLVAKLVNQSTAREEFLPIEAEGSWWFNVDADSSYQAEVGFYAPNRPFVRVMFSNVLETPRKSPSPRVATDADWAISAHDFAEVLDSSGYTQDAFEVALAGDDIEVSNHATQNAFSQFIGAQETNAVEINAEEIRFALLAIASGYSLEDLRGHIGAELFAVLQKNADNLTVENALAALNDNFDVSMEEVELEEEFVGDAVFGASLVNFPRISKTKRTSPKTLLPKSMTSDLGRKISPISSFQFLS